MEENTRLLDTFGEKDVCKEGTPEAQGREAGRAPRLNI